MIREKSLKIVPVVVPGRFVTIEEGEERSYSIRFRLRRIGRINFSGIYQCVRWCANGSFSTKHIWSPVY
uniref:Translation initiation factor 1 n=1 Tax=Ditylenchus dipsaci TaxID=166011 RepID=A0A915CWX3_9BILA